MSSVNRPTVFFRRFNNDEDDEVDENYTQQTFTTPPVQGFHLLYTFERRMWLEIEHVHSGYVLIQLIFLPELRAMNIFPNCKPKEMAYSFLIMITDTCRRRADFVHVLAKIALYFCSCDTSTAEGEAVRQCAITKLIEDRYNFVSAITQQASHVKPSETILAVNDFMSNNTTKSITFDLTNKHRSNKMNLNFICYTIFGHWLKFHGQRKVREEVYGIKPRKEGSASSTEHVPQQKKHAYKKSVDHIKKCSANLPPMSSELEFVSPSAQQSATQGGLNGSVHQSASSNSERPVPLKIPYKLLAEEEARWAGCSGIVPLHILNDKVSSSLYIQMPTHVYELVSSSFDIYSAGHLLTKNHWRTSVESGKTTCKGGATFLIPQSTPEFRDPHDILHVARNGSMIIKKFLPKYKIRLIPLVRFVMSHGVGDTQRKAGEGSILNLGISPEYNKQDEIEFKVKGQDAFKKLPKVERDEILRSIGQLADLLWDVMNEFQLLSKLEPMGGTTKRDEMFASLLRSFIFAETMEFEWITLSVILIWPNLLGCLGHKDTKNSWLYRYSKTGAANFVVMDRDGNLYLLQVIVNFRGTIDRRVLNFKKHVDVIVANIVRWTTELKRQYRLHCATFTDVPETFSFVKDPFNMEDMCLHRDSPYEEKDIGIHSHSILKKYVVLPVGISRALSLSNMIGAIYKHIDYLKMDQVIELCFVGACLNSTVRFHEVLWNATEKDLKTDKHPFKFWIRRTLELFPNQWQGGPYARFVSMGCETKDFLSFFVPKHMYTVRDLVPVGASTTKFQSSVELVDAYGLEEGDDSGDVALLKITEALAEHVRWINTFQGCHKSEQIPYEVILNQMEATLKKVKAAALVSGLEFDLFRLEIFTELISALGVPEPGPHLLQLMIPASEKQRSYKHLSNPLIDKLTDDKAYRMSSGSEGGGPSEIPIVIGVEDFDSCSSEASRLLGRPFYRRNPIESCLCESIGDGITYGKLEVYAEGVSLHNLQNTGYAVMKEYGRESIWMATKRPSKQFAFLTIATL
jgi:hypothetical protein